MISFFCFLDFVLYCRCLESHFVWFFFISFFPFKPLAGCQKNVRKMIVKSVLISVFALPFFKLTSVVARENAMVSNSNSFAVFLYYIMYIGKRIIQLFVPMFGESNCGWQFVIRFGKIFIECHLLIFVQIWLLLPGISRNFVYIIGVINVANGHKIVFHSSIVLGNSEMCSNEDFRWLK